MAKPLAKVLIVEDEPPMLMALSEKFRKENFDVLEAKNGEEALKSALKNHPDLILLDLIMPKMDGMTVMKKLREDEWGKKAPIIIITNLNMDDKIVKSVSKDEPAFYLMKAEMRMEDIVAKAKEVLKM